MMNSWWTASYKQLTTYIFLPELRCIDAECSENEILIHLKFVKTVLTYIIRHFITAYFRTAVKVLSSCSLEHVMSWTWLAMREIRSGPLQFQKFLLVLIQYSVVSCPDNFPTTWENLDFQYPVSGDFRFSTDPWSAEDDAVDFLLLRLAVCKRQTSIYCCFYFYLNYRALLTLLVKYTWNHNVTH